MAAGGKVAVVFGCGGDRDPGKRPLMGRVAGELADLPIATSDNPRSEDPLAILAAVEEGLAASGNRGYRVVPDRREAIREAVAAARPRLGRAGGRQGARARADRRRREAAVLRPRRDRRRPWRSALARLSVG